MLSVSVLGFSLLTTSAFACEHSGNSRSGEGTSWSLTGWFHNLVAESHRECDRTARIAAGATTVTAEEATVAATAAPAARRAVLQAARPVVPRAFDRWLNRRRYGRPRAKNQRLFQNLERPGKIV